jgi:AraC-like DNA-binding protein
MPNLKRRPRPREKMPTSGQRRRLEYRDRIKIHTLRHICNWSLTQISQELKIPRSTVQEVLKTPETPSPLLGRPPMLNTPLRLRLVQRATLDTRHRRLTYEQIADLEGIKACRRTLTAAFEKEQYHRRVATEKPLLTEQHKADRLTWALAHVGWSLEKWARVI